MRRLLTGLGAAIGLAVLFSAPLPGSPEPRCRRPRLPAFPPRSPWSGHGGATAAGWASTAPSATPRAPYTWSDKSILAHYYGGTVLAQTAVSTDHR